VWAGAAGVSTLSLVPAAASVLLLLGSAVAAVLALRSRRSTPPVRPRGAPEPMAALRPVLVGCLALTVIVTWKLWQSRGSPPMLEVRGIGIPQLSVGVPLLASLGWSAFRPRTGIPVFLGLLVYAFLADQTRLQPEVVSLAFLLTTTVLPRWGPVLARTHLSSMWCWTGLHKLLSLGFFAGGAQWMFDALPVRPAMLRAHFGWFAAGLEIAVGLLTALPRTRRLGVATALLLHGTILYVLSPLGYDWNRSVWPWNVAIPVAAVAVFWPWADRVPVGDEGRATRARPAMVSACVLLALFPVGFYFGVVDAYMAHNLYTDNTAIAYCLPACGRSSMQDTWTELAVPLPPEPRLFRDYFDKTCAAGDRLIVSPRRVRLLFGLHSTPEQRRCPAGEVPP